MNLKECLLIAVVIRDLTVAWAAATIRLLIAWAGAFCLLGRWSSRQFWHLSEKYPALMFSAGAFLLGVVLIAWSYVITYNELGHQGLVGLLFVVGALMILVAFWRPITWLLDTEARNEIG